MRFQRPKVGGPTIKTAHLPAPLGGVNAVAPMASMPSSDVLWAYNAIPSEKGLRSRLGYREHCTGLTGGAPVAVRTVLSFQGSTASADRLFATTPSGIWDVTTTSGAPTQVLAFASTTGLAGWGVGLVYVTAAGHFFIYTDEVNGLHVYSESTGTWAKVAMGAGGSEISGVDPGNLVHVAVFKKRLFFTERGSSRGWYLDAGSIYGAATSFDFGPQFKQGGSLVGCFNWTYDGGSGLDDSLVVVSSGGDVAIYQGTDPDDANAFGLKGVWTVPPPPAGRRIATDVGGDLLLLTRSGIRPASVLVSGAPPEDKGADATFKVSPRFAALAQERGNLYGWAIYQHPTDNALVVTIPTANAASEQLVYHLPTRSWWAYEDLPIVGAGVFGGTFYFGTLDGRVCANTGWVDNVSRTDSSVWTRIECGFLSAYQSLGVGVRKLEMFRPSFAGEAGDVVSSVTARYNFDTSRPTHPTSNGGGGVNAWGSGLWGSAVWTDEATTAKVQGAAGMGREVALAVQWNAIGQTTLLGVDVYLTSGGPL